MLFFSISILCLYYCVVVFFRSKVYEIREGLGGREVGGYGISGQRLGRLGGLCDSWTLPSAGVMWLEILLASVLGFVIYWFVSRDKEETLPLEDGWWGPGARPTGVEDESIRPFKVETSDEEINVRPLFPGRAGQRGGEKCLLGLGLRLGLGRKGRRPSGACVLVRSSPTGHTGCSRETCPACPLCPLGPFSFSFPPFSTQGPSRPQWEGSACWPQLCPSKATKSNCFASFVPDLKPGEGACRRKQAGFHQGLDRDPE